MDAIRFSPMAHERCDSCRCAADYGFFFGILPPEEMTGPEDESFLCSGCAQRLLDSDFLQGAIDAQDDGLEEGLWNRAIAGWIDFEVLAG